MSTENINIQNENLENGTDDATQHKVCEAHISIRSWFDYKGMELKLDPLRLCIVGEQSTGKSSLVEQLIGFPCSVTKFAGGTRCPVSYVLRRNPTLSDPKVIKPPVASNEVLLQEISAHMHAIAESPSPFTAIPYEVVIEGPDYQDMELLDLPGFQIQGFNIRGWGDAPAENACPIAQICQVYLRDPNYFIVLVLESRLEFVNAKSLSIVDRLCNGQDDAVPSRPARRDWRDDILYIGNYFDGFIANLAYEELDNRDRDFGINIYGEPLMIYTCLKGNRDDPRLMPSLPSYQQKQANIAAVPLKEKAMVNAWCRDTVDRFPYVRLNPAFEYGGARVGIEAVKKRIDNVRFRTFIHNISVLHGKLGDRANDFIQLTVTSTTPPTAAAGRSRIRT